MNKMIGDKSAEKLHGLLADLHHKIQKGAVTRLQLEKFLNKQNPFATPTKLTVNGSDSRWETLEGDYWYVNSSLRAEHFPIANPGVHDVEYDIDSFDHDPTTQEIMDWQNEPGFRPPDRAEAETYLDNAPDSKAQLGKSPIVAICGPLVDGEVACAIAHVNGRNLDRHSLGNRWYRQYRFLRVRK